MPELPECQSVSEFSRIPLQGRSRQPNPGERPMAAVASQALTDLAGLVGFRYLRPRIAQNRAWHRVGARECGSTSTSDGSRASVLTLGSLELAARGYFRLCPPIGHVDRWEFRSTRPPAYERAEYFSKEFLAESLVCQREFVPPPGKTFLVPGDFFGRWINVSGG